MLERLNRISTANASLTMVLTALIWAGDRVLGRWAAGHIPPLTLGFLRWSIAALVFTPFAWASLKRDWPVIRDNWVILFILGLLGAGMMNTVQYVGLTETTATNAAIFNSWAPVLIAAGGALVFREQLSALQIGGLLLSLAGVITIVTKGAPASLLNWAFNRGDVICLSATVIWAVYTVLLRKRPAVSTVSFAAILFIVAGVSNLPFAAWEAANGQHVAWSWLSITGILYTALLSSVLAYILYARSAEVIGPTRTSTFIHLIPLFTSVLAIIFLGETPQLYHALGFVMILSGVALASRKPAASPVVSDLV